MNMALTWIGIGLVVVFIIMERVWSAKKEEK